MRGFVQAHPVVFMLDLIKFAWANLERFNFSPLSAGTTLPLRGLDDQLFRFFAGLQINLIKDLPFLTLSFSPRCRRS